LAVALCGVSSVAGCAGSNSLAPTSGYLGDTRFEQAERPPYLPVPAASHGASTGGARALVTEAPLDQARRLALLWTRALQDAEEQALEALLPAHVTDVDEVALKTRAELVERCMREARPLAYAPPVPIEDASEQVERIVRVDSIVHKQLPLGLLPSDLLVRLPWRPASGQPARPPCARVLVVRPGARPFVVGYVK
jgi:hypothetical protein